MAQDTKDVNKLLSDRLNRLAASPKEVFQVGESPARPSAKILDFFASVAIVSVLAAASLGSTDAFAGKAHHDKGSAVPTQKAAFEIAHKATLDNEGGSQMTIDMPVKKGGKTIGYKRIYAGSTDSTDIAHGDNGTTFTNTKTGQSVTVPMADLNAKLPVVTNAGMDSRTHGMAVIDLTPEQIKALYLKNYWSPAILAAGVNVAKIAYDITVNQGPKVRNELIAKVLLDLADHHVNPAIGLSKGDIAIMAGIEKDRPGALAYGLGLAAIERYEELGHQAKHKQNVAGWINRAESYLAIAGEAGKVGHEFLLAAADRGREAVLMGEGLSVDQNQVPPLDKNAVGLPLGYVAEQAVVTAYNGAPVVPVVPPVPPVDPGYGEQGYGSDERGMGF